MKLGRRPVRRDSRIPCLARYTRAISLPPPPAVVVPPALDWPMDLNDQIGDCTIAAAAHAMQLWTAAVISTAESPLKIMPDAEVLAAYEQIGGYDPANPDTDRGCVEVDVLETWMNTGIAGDKLDAYCSLNITDPDELKDAVNWFGCAYLGINCPKSAIEDTRRWDVVPGSPIEGGHAIICVGYDPENFYMVSWGKLIPASPAFVTQYLEEAYAPLSRDFVGEWGTTPAGLDLAQLEADMGLLRAKP